MTALSNLLRRVRTAALWLAGPADWIVRRGSGREGLPPLWLRRHSGATAKFESSAKDMAVFLDRLGVLRETDNILDVGCGAGAMTAELARRLGPGRRYVGFDVHAPSIRWCRKAFAGDPRLRFEVAPLASPYGSRSGAAVTAYRFPIEDAGAGFILAKSVFTHLLEPEARRYLLEIHRALEPGRGAILTAFLFDNDPWRVESVARAFPFVDNSERVRWRFRLRPAAAVAYERRHFYELVESAGLRVQWMSPGYFPGAERLIGQDTLLLGH